MKSVNRPIINILLAMLSFLSLTLLPAMASPQSCCMVTHTAVAAETCMCSQTSECCKESAPVSLAMDRAGVSVKQLKQTQVPYNAVVWSPPVHVVRLAVATSSFKKPAERVESNNKRYLMLRVLLI